MLNSKRFSIVLIASVVVATLSAVPSLRSGVDLAQVVIFALLEVVLGGVSFRWWYNQLYKGPYNYCSPLAIVSVLAYIYGGPGNCLAFAYRGSIFGNSGGWDDFLLPLVATIFGVLAFDIAYRFVSNKLVEKFPCRDLSIYSGTIKWRRGSQFDAVLWVAVVVSINLYLGGKYALWSQGSIPGSELDNVLFQSRFAMIATAWGCISVALISAKGRLEKVVTGLLFLPLVPYLASFLSRQYIFRMALCTVFAYMLVRSNHRFRLKALVVIGVGAGILFIVTSNFRTHFDIGGVSQRATGTVMGQLMADEIDLERTLATLGSTDQNRLAGLEFASAIQASHRQFGTPWMHGEHNWLFAVRSVPRVIYQDKPTIDPEVAINYHFGQANIDQLTTPLSSGYADCGPIGTVLGFTFMGLSLCLLQHWVWKWKSGLVLYLGSTALLLNFEQYVTEYPLGWIRFLIIVYIVDCVVRVVSTLLSTIWNKNLPETHGEVSRRNMRGMTEVRGYRTY